MQNALTIFPFPLAMVDAPPPSAETTDQGFALAFDEDLVLPEGDSPKLEALAVAPLLPPLWAGPVPPIAAVLPPGIEDDVKAPDFDPGSMAVLGANLAVSDLSQTVAAPEIPDPGAAEGHPKPQVAISAGLDDAAGPGLPGKIIADLAGMPSDRALQPDPPPDSSSGLGPAGSLPKETQAPPAPARFMSVAATDAAPGTTRVADDSAGTVTVPTMSAAEGVDGDPVEKSARKASVEPENSDRVQTARVDQFDSEKDDKFSGSEPSLSHLGAKGRDIDRTDIDPHVRVTLDVSSDPELAQTPGWSGSVEDVESPPDPAFTLLPRELSGHQSQPASFWERFFAGLTAPRAATGLQADQGAGPDPRAFPLDAMVASATDFLPVKTPADPISNQTVDPSPERSRTVVLSELPTKERSLQDAGPPLPLPERQILPTPLMLLSGWDKGLLVSREQLDLALLSGPALQPGSSFSAASGPQIPMPLPVQQVAGQLASVLVDVSDKATELALAPEELGRVSLRLEPDATNPDRMTILINVERPETLDLFRRHAGELADAIRAAGYSGADIGFGQQGQGSSPDHRPGGNAPGPERPAEDHAPVSPARREVVGTTLDLRL